jgi:putative phosphoribosyl transferase
MIDSENNPGKFSTPDMQGNPVTTEYHGRLIQVGAGAVTRDGILTYPPGAHGIVVLAHGLQNIDQNPHQNALALADILYQNRLATLHVDLFNSEERKLDDETAYFRENIEIMQQRLIGIADWLLENPETQNLSVGFFGNGVVGAAGLIAAAERPDAIAAVVSAGGRADMARDYLPRVSAPVLLIAAEKDEAEVKANQDALNLLTSQKQFERVAGASSLFEDQSSVDEVARLAGQWFSRWLVTIL